MTVPSMPCDLQRWYRGWLHEEEERRGLAHDAYHRNGPSLDQVHFVRDHLAPLVWRGVRYEDQPRADIGLGHPERTLARVISEHRSKSVRLPVYEVERPAIGLSLTMRENYHDWNVSVISEQELQPEEFRGLAALGFTEEESRKFHDRGGFKPGDYWDYLYFQGFPEDRCFGPPSLDRRRFSLCVVTDHQLYTLVWLIMNQLAPL